MYAFALNDLPPCSNRMMPSRARPPFRCVSMSTTPHSSIFLFISVSACSLFSHSVSFPPTNTQEKARVQTLLGSVALGISSLLQSLNFGTSALAELVQWDVSNSTLTSFPTIAQRLLKVSTAQVANIQVAPNAIVGNIFPLSGNEPAIGQNLLADPTRREAALLAISTNTYFASGPLMSKQGYMAFIARKPVFLNVSDSEMHQRFGFYPNITGFWGFATAMMKIEGMFNIAALRDLTSFEYSYLISSGMLLGTRSIIYTFHNVPIIM
jgi:sensor domain CHASE-containing protein